MFPIRPSNDESDGSSEFGLSLCWTEVFVWVVCCGSGAGIGQRGRLRCNEIGTRVKAGWLVANPRIAKG